jgi:hypothetical protein
MDVVMRQWETFFLERCGREREVVSAPLPRAKRPAVDDAPASPERESHANPNETLIG